MVTLNKTKTILVENNQYPGKTRITMAYSGKNYNLAQGQITSEAISKATAPDMSRLEAVSSNS